MKSTDSRSDQIIQTEKLPTRQRQYSSDQDQGPNGQSSLRANASGSKDGLKKLNERLTNQLLKVSTLRIKTEPPSPSRQIPPSSEPHTPNESPDEEELVEEVNIDEMDEQDVDDDEELDNDQSDDDEEDESRAGVSENSADRSRHTFLDESDDELYTHRTASDHSDQENRLVQIKSSPSTKMTVNASNDAYSNQLKRQQLINADAVLHDHMSCTKYSETASAPTIVTPAQEPSNPTTLANGTIVTISTSSVARVQSAPEPVKRVVPPIVVSTTSIGSNPATVSHVITSRAPPSQTATAPPPGQTSASGATLNKPIRLDWNQVRNSLASSAATDSLVEVLQNYILTQADIIQHLHESLQKKERQLAGVKQDREAYILRCANLEKRVEQLSKQVVIPSSSAAANSLAASASSLPLAESPFSDIIKSPGSETPTGAFDQISAETSITKIEITSDDRNADSSVVKTIQTREIASQTRLDSSAFDAATGLPKITIQTAELPRKRTLSPVSSMSLGSFRKRRKEETSTFRPTATPTNESIKIYLRTDPIQRQTKVESITITPPSSSSKPVVSETIRPKSRTDSQTAGWPDSILTTNKPYPIVVSRIRALTNLKSGGLASGLELLEKECAQQTKNVAHHSSDSQSVIDTSNKAPTATAERATSDATSSFLESYRNRKRLAQAKIETPSFRINPIGVSHSSDICESLDDATFLKRHQKPEKDEIRRKRWDLQKLREQQYNARLRQGRYYSEAKNAAATSGSKRKNSRPELDSFAPDISELQAIEIVDRLPVVAFGFPIPKLNMLPFSLPEEWSAARPSKEAIKTASNAATTGKNIDDDSGPRSASSSSNSHGSSAMVTRTTSSSPASCATAMVGGVLKARPPGVKTTIQHRKRKR